MSIRKVISSKATKVLKKIDPKKKKASARSGPVDFSVTAPTRVNPQWVMSMHQFYSEHGYYRTEDLRKVLGHPTKGIQVPDEVNDIAAFSAHHK